MKVFEAAIIGSGFAGLGMAIRLQKKGISDIVLFERASDVGGVWRDNTYPGCACDVESHLYSFSFFPNPDWSRMFSSREEIWAYLKKCAWQFGVGSKIRLNHEVLGLRWEQDSKRWLIETSQGIYYAQSVISGTGAFSEPMIPSFKGLEDFQGAKFHSSNWDHGVDLNNKRIAVIGTGASAIQFVPEIQPQAQKLWLFQRTAPWILPRPDRPIGMVERQRFRKFPWLQLLWRLRIYLYRELYGLTFRHSRWFEFGKSMALHQMRKVVKDPGLRKKLTPPYTIGCKRILLSNNYYPAIVQDNVDVVSEEIREIKAQSITTQDGVERFVDVIIFGTGFKVTDFVMSDRVFGRSGVSMAQSWRGSPRAYLGTTCTDFPNFFFLLGPNTGLGHSSVVLMIEAQISLVVQALLYMKKNRIREIEPRESALSRYNHELDRQASRTVWNVGGCMSWYLDRTGRNSTLWPGSIGAFRRRTRKFRPADYNFL